VSADFVPLADVLRPKAAACAAPAGGESAADCGDTALVTEPVNDVPADAVAAIREARLFRARLADAFDAASARLIRELASDVLARELKLAPCDLDALLRRAVERAPVVRVRVAPVDLPRLRDVACVADPQLAPGDAIVELDGGALDARFGVRLAAVLEGFA
jgi:flagellar biosynthesis/type III secretory pathway protein FliH